MKREANQKHRPQRAEKGGRSNGVQIQNLMLRLHLFLAMSLTLPLGLLLCCFYHPCGGDASANIMVEAG